MEKSRITMGWDSCLPKDRKRAQGADGTKVNECLRSCFYKLKLELECFINEWASKFISDSCLVGTFWQIKIMFFQHGFAWGPLEENAQRGEEHTPGLSHHSSRWQELLLAGVTPKAQCQPTPRRCSSPGQPPAPCRSHPACLPASEDEGLCSPAVRIKELSVPRALSEGQALRQAHYKFPCAFSHTTISQIKQYFPHIKSEEMRCWGFVTRPGPGTC